MKKVVSIGFSLVLASALALTGCGSKSGSGSNSPVPSAGGNKDLKGEIVIWGGKDKMEIQADFEKEYPGIKLKAVKMDNAGDAALTAIAAGQGAPDVFFIGNGDLKKFNTIAGLEDLSKAPYNALQYKDNYTNGLWEQMWSLDGKKMIAWPWDYPPMATYYRTDIMEENGFPSDPKELGEYMKDPDTFFAMMEKLQAKGISLIQGDWEILSLMTSGIGFFDKDLNWLRGPKGQYAERFVKGLDMSKKSKQLKLGQNINYWVPEGQALLNTGKLVMVHQGVWWPNAMLEQWAPDTKDKWKATTLPLGAYAASGGTVGLIPTQSKNKEAAFEFLKFLTTSDAGLKGNLKIAYPTGYKPLWDKDEWKNVENPFLSKQKVGPLYSEIIKHIEPLYFTPLDDDAKVIWDKITGETIDKGTDSAQALQQIQDEVEKAVKIKKDNLLRVRSGQ